MIKEKQRVYNILREKILSSTKIACISHRNPDIDTLGSSLGLKYLIQENFSEKHIDLICIDEIPLKYHFLKGVKDFRQDFDPREYDLIIFLDSGSQSQTGFDVKYRELFDKKTFPTISIDHHISNEIYAKQNILNTTFSSTTMIIFEIAFLLNWKISPEVATCLLAGIYTDTGGLKHSNTDSNTFQYAAKLKDLGGDISLIVDNFFHKNNLSTLRLWGKILSNSFLDRNNILSSYVYEDMLRDSGASKNDIGGAIDYLNMTEGIRYSLLVSQQGEFVKASLRTLRDDIDLTQIAKKFSGGGHKKASGFTTKGVLKPVHSIQLTS